MQGLTCEKFKYTSWNIDELWIIIIKWFYLFIVLFNFLFFLASLNPVISRWLGIDIFFLCVWLILKETSAIDLIQGLKWVYLWIKNSICQF